MSRGPGRIEKAIERIFAESPSKTFSTDELAALAYPTVGRIEKKHRVAILRAADKVAARLYWEKWQCERVGWGTRWPGSKRESLKGRGAIYVNVLDIWSYAHGRLRAENYSGALSEDGRDAKLGQGGDHHKYVVPRGAWWIHVEERKCEVAGVEPGPELQALIDEQRKEFAAWSAGFQAMGGRNEDDAQRAARHESYERRKKANHDGSICGNCGRDLQPDEPVVRDLVGLGRSFIGGYRTGIEVRCLDCGRAHKEYAHSRKCLTCGRMVYQLPRGRKRTFCCVLHQRRYYR
jgi:hypothetical protein